jgi:coenzyme Q-binding protein COQ10
VLSHQEQRRVAWSPEQMFDLVADIAAYPQFMPWCQAVRIRERHDQMVLADLIVGFNVMREKFTSRVTLERPNRIHVHYLDGPLRSLHNQWLFSPTEQGGCLIDFQVDFEFQSRVMQKLATIFFAEVVSRMVNSFEQRARILYPLSSA